MNAWMNIAFDEATKGMLDLDGGPFGAVIVKDDTIIAQAHNEVVKSNDPTAHAEIRAIQKASQVLNSFDLSSCTLYTTCMPCPMCLGAIFWARIPTVYYALSKEDAAKAGFDDKRFYDMIQGKNHDLDFKQIDKEENERLLAMWQELEGKTVY